MDSSRAHWVDTTQYQRSEGRIGLTVRPRNNCFEFAEVVPGCGGAKAGVEPGDLLLCVDECPIVNWPLDMVVSMLKGEPGTELPAEPWTYPFNVAYPEDWLSSVCAEAGLVWRELDWHHPGATWAAIVRDERRLPEAGWALGHKGLAAPRWTA